MELHDHAPRRTHMHQALYRQVLGHHPTGVTVETPCVHGEPIPE